jgi:hydroxyacylglutathione hydrolase
MRVEQVPLLSDNYAYLVICEQTSQAAVVDPAAADPILERVASLGVELVAIWNTHHHWDHTGGNEKLLAGKTSLAVYGHASDSSRIPGLTCGLEQDDEVTLGSLQARIFHTPGHTTGGIVYCVEDAAFTGDTLFSAGCGRLFEGTAEMMHHSLNGVLGGLDDSTRVFCGHEYTQKNIAFARRVDLENGNVIAREKEVAKLRSHGEPTVPSTLGLERETNPFLRCADPQIRAHLALQDGSDADVFAALRKIRDGS